MSSGNSEEDAMSSALFDRLIFNITGEFKAKIHYLNKI